MAPALAGILIPPLKRQREELVQAFEDQELSAKALISKLTLFYQYYFRALWCIHTALEFIMPTPWRATEYRSMIQAHREFKRRIQHLARQPGYYELLAIPEKVNNEKDLIMDGWGVEYWSSP